MEPADPHLAEIKADAAKAQLLSTVDRVKARLTPLALKRDATDALREKASDLAGRVSDAAAKRPGVAAGVTAAAAFILLYRPIRWIVRTLLKEK
jgi:hypothetical protein